MLLALKSNTPSFVTAGQGGSVPLHMTAKVLWLMAPCLDLDLMCDHVYHCHASVTPSTARVQDESGHL